MCTEHPCEDGTAIGHYIQHRSGKLVLPVFSIGLLVTLSAIIVLTVPLSDESEAYSDLPVLDVRTVDGKSLSGVGAILDDTTLDFTVKTSPGVPETFAVAKGTVLVTGSNYLILTGSETIHFSLSGHMFGSNPYVKDYGLRLSLHTDAACSAAPVASAEFFDNTVFIMGEDLIAGTPYYIKIETVNDVEFDKAPNSANIGFGFDASTSSDYNAVHFHSDDQVVGSNLFRNGEHYSFPNITKEGNVLIGWYDKLPDGTLYRETDTVNLSRDSDLYAFWWGWGPEECHYGTPGGCTVDIVSKVEGSSVLLDVEAASPDKRVTVSLHGVDVANLHIEVPAVINLAGPDDALTEADARNCVDVLGTISNWFSQHGLDPMTKVRTDSGIAKAGVPAIKVLSESGLGFELAPAEGGSMKLDKDALDSVYRQGVAIHLDKDESAIDYQSVTGIDDAVCSFILRIAEDSDMNESQRKTVGNHAAWYAAVVVDGKEISDLRTGKATLSIPFTGATSGETVHTYWVKEDGSREDCGSSYDGTAVTFQTNHLSIYMITAESGGTPLLFVGVAAVLLVLAIPILLGVKRRSG